MHEYPIDYEGRDSNEDAQKIKEVLKSMGHEVSLVDTNINFYENLKNIKTDLVFNLCDDGLRNNSQLEPHVPAILDILEMPYTGSNYFTLAICLDKARTKEILSYYKIPTPKFQVFYSKDDKLDSRLKFPLIVKPLREDASIGIKNDSVVENRDQLRKKFLSVIETYNQPALVEEFIDGREVNVSLLGTKNPDVLPIAEIDFSNLPKEYKKFCPYDSKWINDSQFYRATPSICPTNLSNGLEKRIRKIAYDAYTIFGCRDYGRIDFRIGENNKPYVLEVNPNPDISLDAGLAKAAMVYGLTYDKLIDKILNSAMERYKFKEKNKNK